MTSNNSVSKVRGEAEMRKIQKNLDAIYQEPLSPQSKGRVKVAIDLIAYLLGETNSFDVSYVLRRGAAT